MLTRRRSLPALAAVLVAAFAAAAMLTDEREIARADTRADASALSAGAGEPWLHDRYADERAEFLVALTAVESGAGSDRRRDSERLQAYPLYPYLEAARIAAALAGAQSAPGPADDAAHRFLDRHAAAPVGREVRRAWLASLARREEWQAFLDVFDPEAADRALRCQALRARIELGDIEGLAPAVVDTWLTANQLPQECEPVFRWLRAEGPLTDELIERRVVLLLEHGQAQFARVIAGRLPKERAAPLLHRADLLLEPRRALDALLAAPDTVSIAAAPSSPGELAAATLPLDAVLAGWQRFARNEPGAALERYEPLLRALDLDRREASPFALALALGLAWDRRAEARELFDRVEPDDLTDYALGWLTRAALWAGDWRLAADAIDTMSPEARSETRWRYWAARAAAKLGDKAAARELYHGILERDNYYSAMAAARLGEPARPDHSRLDVDEERLRRIVQEPAFVRARELEFARRPWLAAAEWRYGSDGLDAADRKETIHLASRFGWHDVAIATATHHRVFDDYALLYPRPYDEAVAAAAELTKLEPALIYGVIRQESLYRADAASAAGAVGLAQLLPDTAKRAAREWQLPAPSYADLFQPMVNVTLGAAELRRLVDELDEQLPVALAGYNAGPNAARRWLPATPLDADVWIENIPYNETRDYVQRVLWHSVVFAWLESGEPRDTESWISDVRPLRSGLQAADTSN